jgi:predicted DsbA family dithiol-disulfide isomerase
MSMNIDVISDVVCPWCFIGKRHLESALASWRKDHAGEEQPQVRWHPFQLNPQLPRSGVPRAEYIATKFGGPQRAKEIYARVANAGARAGIAFDFDKIAVQPNTLNAHRLIHHAGVSGKQDAIAEALFRAYFLEGADLSSDDTLADIATRAGLDRDEISTYLASDEDKALIEDQDQHARSLGVEGVPFFIFNRRYAVSGAQPPEAILDVMAKAEEELAAAPQ